MDQRRRLTQDGFTLIELMIVIAVAGILAVVTVPKYHSLIEQYRLENSAQNVMQRIKHAKQLAMDERKNIGIALTDTSVQLVLVTNPQLEQVLFTPLGSSQKFDLGIILDGTTGSWPGQNEYSNYLYFDYRGFLQMNGADPKGTIVLKSTQSDRKVSVELDRGTGNTTIAWP